MASELNREALRTWLDKQLSGPFADLRGSIGLVGDFDRRREWEATLGEAGLSCIGWPVEYGGRDAGIADQVMMAEEYARAKAPPRIGHLGIELLGPTLIAFGSEANKARFLPPIVRGEAIWAQGYSEPNAGSDLSNIRTRAELREGRWVINGQKSWTSLGACADWLFLLARAEVGSVGSQGLVFLLVPIDQPGVTVRPIQQMTGEAEFAEMFFDGAETEIGNIVGAVGEGWRIAMALLGFERGVSTVVQQMQFANEFEALIAAARANGSAADPLIRQRLAKYWTGLKIMRFNMLRMLEAGGEGTLEEAGLTSKLYWSRWHRDFGELAMDVLGLAGEAGPADGGLEGLDPLVRTYLAARADTIYAGSSQIQRNIIAERALGLPRELRGRS